MNEDVRESLLELPRTLSPKYFYDDHGSRLFDAICDTREYYPTRTEDALLAVHAAGIIATHRPEHVVELGSGAARKTRHIFDACETESCKAQYWPFDVCRGMIMDSAQQLAGEYDWLTINGLVGDYHAGLKHFPHFEGRTLYVFLGGTIGNFEHEQAVQLLSELRGVMGDDDLLLIGADRVKDHAVLNAAYNDSDGVTAEFNLNVLRVLNRELDADFDLDSFDHHAHFNAEQSRIEMHLVATENQCVQVNALDATIEFNVGETILTEISRKFTPETLEGLLTESGLELQQHFEPENQYFSLVLAGRPAGTV
jgi:L-histidine N-alpha-methyltransferase